MASERLGTRDGLLQGVITYWRARICRPTRAGDALWRPGGSPVCTGMPWSWGLPWLLFESRSRFFFSLSRVSRHWAPLALSAYSREPFLPTRVARVALSSDDLLRGGAEQPVTTRYIRAETNVIRECAVLALARFERLSPRSSLHGQVSEL